jgi:hypothetical protein
LARKVERSIYDLIDLSLEGLEQVKKAVESNMFDKAAKLLKEYYLFRRSPKLFLDDSEKQRLVNYSKENFIEDIKEVITVSEEVSKNTFVFRFPWDMEKTNKPFTFKNKILWHHIPFEDEEWAFMLNRHRYWISLGQAYAVTGNEEYAKTFCNQLESFIDSNPVDGKWASITWRSIEAGIRCENWIKAFQYFKYSAYFTEQLLVKMLLCLYEHSKYLMSRYDNFRHISNWGVLENHGLFEASVFLSEFKESRAWREESLRRLKTCAELQVLKDGVHWEQSPMYHNEVLHCFMDVIILGEKNNIFIDKAIKDAARNMAYADLYMAKPNHHQPMLSDSDDTDIRDMLTEAAIIFNDEILKFGAYKSIDFNSLWLFGAEGINKFQEIQCRAPEVLSVPMESSGNYVMRSSFDEDAKYLLFDCGSIGGGHGHCDILHFDIHAYGRDLISDTGRYTYVEGEPLREYFKSCKAHNTTIVDDTDFIKCKGSWGYEKVANALGKLWISKESFDYAEGSHDGYLDLEDPVYSKRRILFVKPYYWLIIDSFQCKKEHSFSQYFHFTPGEVVLDSNRQCYTNFRAGGNVKIVPLKRYDVEARLQNGYYSKEYNHIEDNKVLCYKTAQRGFTSLINVVYPYKAGEDNNIIMESIQVYDNLNNAVEKNIAEGIKIKLPYNAEEHVIFIRHSCGIADNNGTFQSIYTLDSTKVSGEIVLIKKSSSTKKVIVAK